MRPWPRKRSNDPEIRWRLQAALLELCGDRGYLAIDVSALVARAGVEPADWERLYGDLEECACEMLEHFRDEFVSEVATAAFQERTWRAQICAAAHVVLRWFLADHARARFMLIEIADVGDRAILIRDQGMDAMISLIDTGRGELEDPESLTRSTAEAIAGTVFSRMQHVAASGPDPAVAENMFPQLMHTVTLPYLGEEIALEELSITTSRPAGTRAGGL